MPGAPPGAPPAPRDGQPGDAAAEPDVDRWRRELRDLTVVCLFLDAQDHAARQGSDEQEGVLSAAAVLDTGAPVRLPLALGRRDSSDAWLSVVQDLSARGGEGPADGPLRWRARGEQGDQAAGAVTSRRFPAAHHRRIRPTHRLERLAGEGRRRPTGIARCPTERSCLPLLSATLLTASRRGVPMTLTMVKQLEARRAARGTTAADAVA